MSRFLIIVFLLTGVYTFGQKRDALGWFGLGAELPVTKKFEVAFESQLRLDQNLTRYSQLYGEVSGQYEILDDFNVGGLYRYSRKNSGDYFFNENRLTLYAKYRFKFDPGFKFDLKARYQHTFDRITEVNDVFPDKKNLLRLSGKLRYENDALKRFEPYVSAELFYALKPVTETAFFDTYRFRAGVVIDLPERFEINAYYMFEHENRNEDNINHIYSIQVNYAFKRLNKKKKKKKTE